MKLLCVQCDAQMKTVETARQGEDATMTVVFECPECSARFGLLTNQMETRLLDSLDVSVCPVGGQQRQEAEARLKEREAAEARGEPAAEGDASKCPFSGMLAEAEASGDSPTWSAEAEARLESIPSFARPMARQGIEAFARQRGLTTITAEVMGQARELFGV